MENMHTDVRVSKINHTLLTAPTRKLNKQLWRLFRAFVTKKCRKKNNVLVKH